jgi:3-hydroxyisobutyrate dehydrogenase-like beta-hydroxyacid dehydrogenase
MVDQFAFLGLGVMGSAMAANLARGGCHVLGWNRTGDRPSFKVAKDAGVNVVPGYIGAIKTEKDALKIAAKVLLERGLILGLERLFADSLVKI